MVVAEPSLILHPTLAIESMGNFHHHLMRNSHENQDPSTSVKKHPSAEIGGGVRFSNLVLGKYAAPHINISRPVKFNIPTSQLWQEVKNLEIGRRQTVIWMHFLVCPCPHWVEANFAGEIEGSRQKCIENNQTRMPWTICQKRKLTPSGVENIGQVQDQFGQTMSP